MTCNSNGYESKCCRSCRWMKVIAFIVLSVAVFPFFCRGLSFGADLVSGTRSDRPSMTSPEKGKNFPQRQHRRDKRRQQDHDLDRKMSKLESWNF